MIRSAGCMVHPDPSKPSVNTHNWGLGIVYTTRIVLELEPFIIPSSVTQGYLWTSDSQELSKHQLHGASQAVSVLQTPILSFISLATADYRVYLSLYYLAFSSHTHRRLRTHENTHTHTQTHTHTDKHITHTHKNPIYYSKILAQLI